MPLALNREVFITCAVTGSGSTQDRSPKVPRSPEQIANEAIAAARAGAAIVHCHVRDPETGAPARAPELYRELTERIRAANVDMVLNLTAGMGGDLVFGPPSAPLPLQSGTDMASAEERLEHVRQCRPEICTLDCGTMNFAEADYVMTNTPGMLRAMAKTINELGVKPELEVMESGHLWFAKSMIAEGLIVDPPPFLQLCMGIPWGAPDDLNSFLAMVNNLPQGAIWSAFSIGRNQLPYVAAAALAGGNVRVGLEDNLWLERGVLADNASLVERAVTLLGTLGCSVLGPQQVRERLGLNKRSPL